MTKNTNIPKLRFPEFKKEWLNSTLGDKVEIVGGGTPETNIEEYWNGDINWFTPTEIKSKYVSESQRKITEKALKSSSAKLLPIGAVLLTTRATIGLSAITNTLSTTNQGFQSFLPNSNVNNEFIYYWTKTKLNEFIKRANGSTFIEISKNSLKEIDFTSPELEEQTKIASFLTAVDDKLQALKKKKELLEQYKKGMMQQLFSQEIRFKKDDGTNYPDWEEKKLSEVASRITRKNKEYNLNVLTISAQFGLVSQLEYFNKSVSAKDVSGYYLIHKDEFAYNKSYSNGYPMGAIKRLNKYKKGVVSTLYICFSVNSEMVSCDFIEQYFETGLQNSEIEKFAQEGARNHGLLNIGVNDFFEIQLVLPCIEEQTKIANFLSALDDKIAHCQSELDGLEQWKKGLLQQMFC